MSNEIDITGIAVAVAPLAKAAISALFLSLGTWALAIWSKVTKQQISDKALADLRSHAEDAAASLVSAAEDNLATKSITITSPGVRTAVQAIVSNFPDILQKTGMTEGHVAVLVTGAVGRLQASMTRNTVK
jgi:hypothetical protein